MAKWALGKSKYMGRGRFDFIRYEMLNKLLTLVRTRENNKRRNRKEQMKAWASVIHPLTVEDLILSRS